MRDSKQDILQFWFTETDPALWFQENETFDGILRVRYEGACERARGGLCDEWQRDADGSVALCLLLSEFPRHIYRGQAQAYLTDGKALLVAKHAVARGFDQLLTPERRRFLYLPYMHSELRANQKKSLELFEKMSRDDRLSFEHAQRHARLIDQFGRFPQRNKILGRSNTPDENEYLNATPVFA